MSSTPLLQCLFCNHHNPAGASFCNACGSPMDLQPCEQCDAIDKRTARNCYKCGAEFAVPAAPAPDPALATESPDKPLSEPVLVAAYMAREDAALPSSGLLLPESSSRKLPDQSADSFAPENGAADQQASGSRRLRRVALAGLLFAALALSAYIYRGQSPHVPAQPAEIRLAPAPGAKPASRETTESSTAAPVDGASNRKVIRQKLAASVDEPEKELSIAPPGAGAVTALQPSSESAAEPDTRADPPILKECPEAVAVLGLCNPNSKQERP